MRRILRILLNSLTVASLMLALATVFLWVRSYWRADSIRWVGDVIAADRPERVPKDRQTRTFFGSLGGRIATTVEITEFPRREGAWSEIGWWATSETLSGDEAAFHRAVRAEMRSAARDRTRFALPAGGYFERRVYVYPPPDSQRWIETWEFYAPHWLISLLAGFLPTLRAVSLGISIRGRRRAGYGMCPSCGYDLRATPDRCPECGAVPDRAEAARDRPA